MYECVWCLRSVTFVECAGTANNVRAVYMLCLRHHHHHHSDDHNNRHKFITHERTARFQWYLETMDLLCGRVSLCVHIV